MKLRHIFEAVISAILPLFQNVVVVFDMTWPMTMPLVLYLWRHFLYGEYEGILFDPIKSFLGISITVAGLLLFFWGAFWFFGKKRGTLVRSGVYGVSRHPQYLGLIVLTLGTSITLLSGEELEAMENWIFIALSYVFLAVYEDEKLAKEYDGYEKYRNNVSFLFPLICSPKICKRFTSRFTEIFLTMLVIFPIYMALTMYYSPQILTPVPIILFVGLILLTALLIDVILRKTTSDKAKTVVLFVYAVIFLASVIHFLLSSHGFAGFQTILFVLLSLTVIEKTRFKEMHEAKGSLVVYSLFFVAILVYTGELWVELHSLSGRINPAFFVAAIAMMVLVDKVKTETRSLSIYRKSSRTFNIVSSILISIPLLVSFIGIIYMNYLNFLSSGYLLPTSNDVFRLLQLFPLIITTVTLETL